MVGRAFRLAILLATLVLLPRAALAQGIDGTWMTTAGKGIVAVEACGERLCGKIVWLKEPKDSKGRPLRDGYNEDPSKRRRPILGLPILLGLVPVARSQWQGWIYDPEKGKSFDVTLVHRAADRIEITGCGLMGLVCETHVWERAEVPVEEQAAEQ